MTLDRTAFCRSLRETRLRRGLTLEAIGEASKISASLLAELERGDLSRWPKGIFRRAFFREYAAAIGLPRETVVEELGWLFPEEDGPAHAGDAATVRSGDALRLTLAPEPQWWMAPNARRSLTACIDGLAVVVVGGLAGMAFGGFLLTTCIVALAYYGLATACTGTTPASVWLSHRGRTRTRDSSPHAAEPATVDRPRLVFRRPDQTHQPVAEREAEPAASNTRRAASS